MKKISCKIIFALLVALCCGVFSSCTQKYDFSIDDFEKRENTASVTYTFSSDDSSEEIICRENNLQEFQEKFLSQPVVYGYEELFNYREALSRIKSGLVVDEHKYSALDHDGKLTAEHLFEIVRKNNSEYLFETALLKDIDDELLHRICEILVETTKDILEQYPEIDRDRVYCNLGNLKVLEKSAALDFAAVEPGMILHINRNTSNMVNILTSSNMYSVLVHETMHIIQYGCECEQIEGCSRRCGLAYAYTDEEQDYSDWAWLAEASAERMTCLYTNVEPMTYHYLVNYLLSLDLAVILKEDVPENYVETLFFYNDLDRLFMSFDAKTEEEKKEIYQLIYALEIMQMEPADVKEAYQRIYGQDWDETVRDDINNKLKRPIVQTLIKQFYCNLSDAVINNSMTKNDLLFLINLLESSMNYHVLFNNSKYDNYNSELVKWYAAVQTAFFDCLENVSLEDYYNYQSYDEDTKKINSGMKWLNEEKQNFLAEKFEDNFCDYKFIYSVTE